MSRAIASFSLINASVCSVKPEGSTSDREAEFSETDAFNGSSASFSSAEDSLITSLEPNTEEEKEVICLGDIIQISLPAIDDLFSTFMLLQAS